MKTVKLSAVRKRKLTQGVYVLQDGRIVYDADALASRRLHGLSVPDYQTACGDIINLDKKGQNNE